MAQVRQTSIVFSVLLIGTNLIFYFILSSTEQRQADQLYSAVRERIIISDIGSVKEYLSRLKPALIQEYHVNLASTTEALSYKGFQRILVYFDLNKTKLAGTIWVQFNRELFQLSLLAVNLIIGGLFFGATWMIKKSAQDEIIVQYRAFEKFLHHLEGIFKHVDTLADGHGVSTYASEQQKRIAILVHESVSNVIVLERQAALGKMASQVSHDIRSPLAALDMVVQHTMSLPEEMRIIIRSSVSRIRDIANNLLQKNKEASLPKCKTSQEEVIEPATIQLLSSLIDPLVTEKRMQFRSKIGIEIDSKLDRASYGLFAKIQSTEFKRMISNLVNNAVEVLGEEGTVIISLSKNTHDKIQIKVQDNGRGIPPDILARLGQRGETHGKEGGSGLGLYHARATAESWGGALGIQSEVGKGTVVILTLLQAQPPEWFVSELLLRPHSTVIILDDDSSVHQVWQERFDAIGVQENEIKLLHYSTPDEIIKWVQENPPHAKKATFLADYELLGYKQTGLDLIETLQIGEQSILVTSRFEEKKIMEECKRLKVRLIPKGLVAFVPIGLGQ